MEPSPDRTEPTAGPGRSLLRAVGLNLAAFALVAAAGEAVVRALPERPAMPSHFEYSPGRKFRYASPPRGAGAAPEFEVEIVLNRYGFHGPDHPPERAAGSRRVAVVGDSMVEAFQVPREQTLAARLEGRLPRLEALGFGMSGHSTVRQEAILERLPSLLGGAGGGGLPDAVLFVVHGPYAVRQALVDFVRPRALWRRGLSWGLLHYGGPSRFLLAARDSVLRGLAVPTDDLLAEAARSLEPGYGSPLLERAWTLVGGAVDRLARSARESGMRPIFVYLPDRSEMEPAGERRDPRAVARRFEALVAGTGADWIDLGDAFRAAAGPDGGGCFFEYDQHLTAKGHDLAAELLAPRLARILEGGK